MELAPEKKKKRTRAGRPKVRTGCLTCKARHLKCDEGKPYCRRCKNHGYRCDGYRPIQKRATNNPSKTGPVNHTVKELLSSESIKYQVSLSEAYDSPSEVDLFHHVRTCMIMEFATAITPLEFWHIHALPLGHTIKPIRAALCSLGSAHKFFKLAGTHRDAKFLSALEEFSIQQYNEAISHIKFFSQKQEKPNLQIVITCCVIFICIENLFGRYSESLQHLKSAYALLRAQKQYGDHVNVKTHIRTFMHNDKFFEDINLMLMGLGQDIATFIDRDAVPELGFHSASTIQCMDPSIPFESTAVAVNHLRILQLELGAELARLQQASSQPPATFHENSIQLPYPQNNIQSLASSFGYWNARFNSFRCRVDDKYLSQQDRYRILGLSLNRTLISTFLDVHSGKNYIPTESYKDILQQAECVIDSLALDSVPVFSFDACLIPALYLLGMSHEDVSIQKSAVTLLRSMRRREGIWNSQEAADIIDAMIYASERNILPHGMLPWNLAQMAGMLSTIPFLKPKLPIDVLLLAQRI